MRKVPDFTKERIVLVIIDMQNESGAGGYWQGYNWDQTVSSAAKVLEACRQRGYPIVHVMVAIDQHGVMCHPYDIRDENGRPVDYVKGTRSAEIIDELKPIEGEIVVEKQRFSAFYQTNLDLVLHGLKAEHLIMMGVFTDACFLTSTYDAFARGYTISIVKDACTAGTEAAHKTSILDMANWIYGCSIFKAAELVKAVKGEKYRAWFWEKADSMRYRLDNITEMYDKL